MWKKLNVFGDEQSTSISKDQNEKSKAYFNSC